MLDGKGTDLRFGGQVMKNVAGYDVSRLMVGSLGTLGVLLEISVKALPNARVEITLRLEHTQAQAIALMNAWAGKPLPITATCHAGKALYVRLAGAEPTVRAARAKLGGEEIADGAAFWQAIREHEHDFFSRGATAVAPVAQVDDAAARSAGPAASRMERSAALARRRHRARPRARAAAAPAAMPRSFAAATKPRVCSIRSRPPS